jgi:hypothetical protein
MVKKVFKLSRHSLYLGGLEEGVRGINGSVAVEGASFIAMSFPSCPGFSTKAVALEASCNAPEGVYDST